MIPSAATPSAAYAYCEQVTRREAKNFYYGIRLLPREKRQAMSAVYALARRADDIGDDALPGATPLNGAGTANGAGAANGAAAAVRLRQLEELRQQVTAGSAPGDDPVLVAVFHVAERFPLPLEAFVDLADGVEMDVRGTSYDTFEELVAYCQRVAGSIGRLSVAIFGVDDLGSAVPLADRLGVALQLTNILRDIREDGEAGRRYLPLQDVAGHGCGFTPDGRLAGSPEQLDALVRFQAQRAETWFADGLRLIPMLDRRSAACCSAMAGIYHRLLLRIEQHPGLVLERRLSLSGWEKASIAARSLSGRQPRGRVAS
jgi:phytoene synthase